MVLMGSSETTVVSVRVKKAVKAKLEKEGINVEQALKEFLNQRARQMELRKTIEAAARTLRSSRVRPSRAGFAERSVREDRDASH